MARLGAYRSDQNDALEALQAVDSPDLASVARLLYAICDSTLGDKDLATCQEEQRDLLNRLPVEVDEGGCPPTVDGKAKPPVIIVGRGCSDALQIGANRDTRTQQVQTGIDEYEKDKPGRLSDLVNALYSECAQREEAINHPTDVLPCWERARALGAKTPYEFVEGGSGCRASLDSTQTHIVLTG